MIRKFDRYVPATMPPHRMLTRPRLVGMPTAVDLRASKGPQKDQGAEGACTAHAGTSCMEWIDRRYFKNSRVYSPQYVYEKELLAQGSFPSDVGSDGETLCKVLIASGCCESALDPYVPGQIVMPTAQQDANARLHTMGAYHGLADAETAISVLGDPVPWPVLVGFTVDDNFQSDKVASTGVYVPSGVSLGEGHEVLAIGYDIGTVPALRPKDCPPAFLIQNSWGTGWGIAGDFWMAMSVFNQPDTDLKIVHTGAPWKVAVAAAVPVTA